MVSYCVKCRKKVDYSVKRETIKENFMGENITYEFDVGRCKTCNNEVATNEDYFLNRAIAIINAYNELQEEENKIPII